jgi:hypothetical protein
MAVVDAGNIAQSTMSAINTGLTAASTAIIEAKTTLMEEFNKLAWVQQAKDMLDSLGKLQDQINEIMGLRDDVMGIMSGARDIGGLVSGGGGADSVDYSYADKTPQAYLDGLSIGCDDSGAKCKVTGNGYTGVINSSKNSKAIRDSWRVDYRDPASIGSFTDVLTEINVNEISNREAEKNAQAIAIIQAMAQEAYMQANNRIERIKELEAKISGATSAMNVKAEHGDSGATGATSANGITSASDGGGNAAEVASPAKNNDLKYIADLQAQIQVQNALLINEQNKLASLAILQQSQRDAYEQRKKEIAAYAVNGGPAGGGLNVGGILKRVAVGTAQTAAYSLVTAAYTTPAEE